jgi:hypothetical protein
MRAWSRLIWHMRSEVVFCEHGNGHHANFLCMYILQSKDPRRNQKITVNCMVPSLFENTFYGKYIS